METTTTVEKLVNIKQTVTDAATFLSRLERQTAPLDDRDRKTAHSIRVELEKVEEVLYAHFGPTSAT